MTPDLCSGVSFAKQCISGFGRPCDLKFYIDRGQTGPETAADIAKAVQPQIWTDYLLILFFRADRFGSDIRI